MYAHMLVGMVALTGQWWLDVRKPKKDEVVAHVVNLAWNGIVGLEIAVPEWTFLLRGCRHCPHLNRVDCSMGRRPGVSGRDALRNISQPYRSVQT